MRDELASSLQELRGQADERLERERRARELLRRMRLEPGSYKFARLPVRDLGLGVLRSLGGPPAPRADRDARRLVAAQAVVRVSVSQGVAVHARPRFTEVSIAASVRR